MHANCMARPSVGRAENTIEQVGTRPELAFLSEIESSVKSVMTVNSNDTPNAYRSKCKMDTNDNEQFEEVTLTQTNMTASHQDHSDKRLSVVDKAGSPCPTLSMDRYIIPFYHSTFEFYAPFPIGLAPFISLDEYERLLTFLNTQLPVDLPRRCRKLSLLFRAFVVLFFFGGLGLLILPFLYYESNRYERDFKAFLIRVAAVLSEKSLCFAKRNIGFSLRNAHLQRMNPRLAKEWTGNLYQYSISIDTLSIPSKKSTPLTTTTFELVSHPEQQESILRSHSTTMIKVV